MITVFPSPFLPDINLRPVVHLVRPSHNSENPYTTKHFYVYTVAGAAKFLLFYYARVKQYLNQMEIASASVSPN